MWAGVQDSQGGNVGSRSIQRENVKKVEALEEVIQLSVIKSFYMTAKTLGSL